MIYKKIYLNGKIYYINQSITINQLIKYFNYSNEVFILEYNTLLCNKKNWDKILLKNLDKIEIITIVGGG